MKSITYAQLKANQQKEVDNFPFMFAFGREQFDEMLKKNNVTVSDICSIGCGGYIRKTDFKAMHDMFDRHTAELAEARKQNKFLKEAILNEMSNHEYCVTYDREEVLNACGITEDDFQKNEDVHKAWNAAKKNYMLAVEA